MPRGMSNELQNYVIDGLIQGVSQQSAWDRRDTQCETQFDCVNSPVNGCEARPGFDFVNILGNTDHTAAFEYEIFRGDTEHYLVVIDKEPSPLDGHKLHVYDMNTGNPCAVNFLTSEDYLNCTVNDPNISLMATTLEDYTFIGNREVTTLMSTTLLSPAKQNEGIIFFKAGGYSITFQVAVTYNGNVYTWTYVTPDNSTTGNAAYISTNQMAATFFRSFTGVDAVVTTTGTTVDDTHLGVGAAGSGDTTGVAGASTTGADTLTALGFTVKLNGNVILIHRDDAQPFDIDSGDGVGDTYLHAIKDTVQNFSDLPQSCFSGFTTKVIGTNIQTNDDYYVQFQGADGSSGYWQEVIAPGTSLTFNPATMPQALVNTGVNTFDFKIPPWGNRVAGDGIYTSLDPSFIGKPLQEMAYDHGRLALMPEGSCVWSRVKNIFVFFPDTAQTTLATDPIDIVPGGGKTIALLRRIIQIAETTFLWAAKIQFRATSGVNPFQQDTVELPPSTNFEFSSTAIPRAVGQSLYFVTETGAWATLRDLAVQNNLPVGATDVTGHVKKYIPAGIRWITASDTLGLLFCNSLGSPSSIFCYNYLLSATARLQSAWNTWRLPSNSSVLWTGMDLNYLYCLVQRQEGAVLLRCDLSVDLTDPDAGATYLTRLDFRVNESQCTIAYNAAMDTSTITLPYPIPEPQGWTPSPGAVCPMMVVNRDSTGTRKRGHSWAITGFPSLTSIAVSGDVRGDKFYAGYRIRAEREASRFYIKTTKGLVPTESILVKSYIVNYGKGTGYFRTEVNYQGRTDNPLIQEMTGTYVGDTLYTIGEVPIPEGTFKCAIDQENDKYTVTLVNDSFLPSRWVSCSLNFKASFIGMPSQFGQSVPSYFAQGGTAGSANNF